MVYNFEKIVYIRSRQESAGGWDTGTGNDIAILVF